MRETAINMPAFGKLAERQRHLRPLLLCLLLVLAFGALHEGPAGLNAQGSAVLDCAPPGGDSETDSDSQSKLLSAYGSLLVGGPADAQPREAAALYLSHNFRLHPIRAPPALIG